MDFSFNVNKTPPGNIFVLLLLFYQISYSQEVEHNYPVGSQKTNCDSLILQGLSFDQKINSIEESTFRFGQNFKISRSSGVRAGHFYSCDGNTGFLILTINKEKVIYEHIPRSLWENFTKATDLDGFFENNIKKIYPVIRKQAP